MGFIDQITYFFGGEPKTEKKAGVQVYTSTPTTLSSEAVAQFLVGSDSHYKVAAVAACARVIAEGLALPPCYIHQEKNGGRTLATNHALYSLLNASPNERQTSYEFREMLGYHLALHGNAYVYVNRNARGEVVELLPCDPGQVSVTADTSQLFGRIDYLLYGVSVPADRVWHLKGPATHSWIGMDTMVEARKAVGLARATENYGAKLFENGARPGAIVSPKDGASLTEAQANSVREQWNAQYTGVNNAHKTVLLTAPLNVQMLASSADEAQWTESRRFQIEEICRYFRVSPIKIFQQTAGHSYASVEQAHIAHDQDTDAHWQQRFVQSANKHLLNEAERRQGYSICIDDRSILRGTASERMKYYADGIAAGIMTRNEARDLEGFDRSTDPQADMLTPAQNLFGAQQALPPSQDTPE